MIPLSSPWVTDEDQQAVLDVLKTQHLALGPKLKEFENLCAEVAGVRYAVATSSGTAALTLGAHALGWGPGDEVITPSFSFVASSNTVMHVGARPRFVDINSATWNLDLQETEFLINSQTRGIQAVDVFGLPCEGDELEALCIKHEIDLVEDACEAVGARHRSGRACGGIGRLGTWAFYPNKQITTGEGGMLLTNDEAVASLVRSLANQGRGEKGWFDSTRLGWNYRLSDIQAALGISQLKRLDVILQKRRQVAEWYRQRLADNEQVELMPDSDRSWFVYVIALHDASKRDPLMTYLRENDIQCQAYFVPIHLMPHMREKWGTREGQFPKTEALAKRTIALPFFTLMTEDQVAQVVEKIEQFLAL